MPTNRKVVKPANPAQPQRRASGTGPGKASRLVFTPVIVRRTGRFESLNRRFFHGLLGRPLLTWSGHVAKRSLGHYDPAHNTIVVSRVFDRKNTPRYAVEYLLYHEMLHLKHPVKVRGGRRCVHPREFQMEERLFPEWHQAKEYLKTI